MTTLSLRQRLDRLEARIDELEHWLARDYLDLRDWTFDGAPLALGAAWPRRDGVVRLEHPAVRVPEGWPLAETRLELDPGGESLLTLRHHHGAESFGVDPYHRHFPLASPAFSLALESVARAPFGVPVLEPRLQRARLVWLDAALLRFRRRLELVAETVAALPSHEVAPMLLSAAERALAQLSWPSATDGYLSRVRDDPQFARLWRAPDAPSDHPPALDDAQRAAVARAGEALAEALAALRRRYPPQGAFALSGHAHIDLAWLWPLDETRRKARRTFATAVSLLARDPDFTFNQSTAQLYAFLEEDDPALFARVRAAVAAGRWEPVGGMWVEPDTLMPTGESLARQLLYGQRYFASRFGGTHRVCWLPDCFGFSPALPQLLRLAGIDAFFTTKTNWNETDTFPHDLFWWEGLDGSRVLSHTFFNPRDAYNGVLGPQLLADVWGNYRGKERHPESLLTVGYGDGGGGTTAEMLERARHLGELPALPAVRWDRVDATFARLRQGAETSATPVWVGEIYLELHRGTLTSQGRTKRLHRRAERALLTAETVTGVAHLLGADAPASLEPQWRVLLRNQFHDILPGSSIHEVYQRAEAELASVVASGAAAVERGLDALAARVARSGEPPALLVLNPDLAERPLRLRLDAPVAGAQAVEGGYLLAGAGSVAGLEVAVLPEIAPVAGLRVTERRLENALLRVELAEDGSLASVYDKRAGREVLAGRGNALWAYVDKPRNWDAWDVEENYREQGEEVVALDALTVTERGPHRAALRLVRTFRNSTITQDIRLWCNSARLEFATRLDWHDRRWLLQARFPLKVRSDAATFECAFGVQRRPTHRNTSWDAARFEVAGHRFADLSEPGYGVALLNDGRYGHHAHGQELGLSLLRSPVWPDPRADEGEHAFTYALLPHAGDWFEGGVAAEAEDLNQPLLARPVQAAEERRVRALRPSGVPLALACLKPREDGPGLVLRCFEPRGARGAAAFGLPAGWRAGREVDLLERELAPDGAPADGRGAETAGERAAEAPAGRAREAAAGRGAEPADLHATFGPFQVRSWVLEPEPPTAPDAAD